MTVKKNLQRLEFLLEQLLQVSFTVFSGHLFHGERISISVKTKMLCILASIFYRLNLKKSNNKLHCQEESYAFKKQFYSNNKNYF